jgi:predicted DNA-binding transcriptional regulator YafY
MLNSMSKRTDNLETLHIALELLRRIPRGSKISAPELRQQLEQAGLVRDLRTIQRQLELLSQHFGIERDDSGRPFGYRWSPAAKPLLQPNLTEQESLLLTLAEQHLRNLLPANLMKSMNGFFSQARNKIGPHTDAQREREWLSKVRVVSETQPLLPPKIRPGVFDEVSSALYANRWLQVDYQNASGKRSRNEVMPLGLAQQGPRLYLVCRYADHENERSLALHRILSANVMAHTFTRPKDFDLKKYDDDGRFGFGEGERISVTFRIDKIAGRHLLETPLSLDQQVIELKSTYEITATVVDSEVFWRWLRGFGKAATIVE